MSDALKETIVLSVDTAAIKAGSLSELLKEVNALDRAIAAVYAKVGRGPTINPQFIQPLTLIQEKLNKAFNTKGPYKAMDLAKAIGLDEASANQIVARLEKIQKLSGFKKSDQTFSSLDSGAKALKNAMLEQQKTLDQMARAHATAIGRAMNGQSGTVAASASGKDVALSVEGTIGLVIPGTQIQASVQGPIELKVAAGQLAGSGGTANNAPGTGQFVAGNSAGKKSGKRKAESGKEGGLAGKTYGEVSAEIQEGELSRTHTETREGGKTLAIRRMSDAGEAITEIYNAAENLIKESSRATTGNSPLARFRTAKAVMNQEFAASKAALDPNDTGHGLASLYTRQAATLRGLASADHPIMAGLPEPVRQLLAAQLHASAGTLDAKALQTINEMNAPGQRLLSALAARKTGTMSGYNWQNYLQGGYAVNTGMPGTVSASMRAYYQRQSNAAAAAAAKANQDPKNLGSPQWQRVGTIIAPGIPLNSYRGAMAMPGLPQWGNAIRFSGGVPPILGAPAAVPGKPNRIMQTLGAAFGPENMLVHTIKAAGWAAAITAIYKPLQLAEYSMHRFLDLGEKMAHLQTVFRGVGGSAKEVADDVMKLAAANGRSTDEALESATEWSRLGMSRVQVNEAVRVSLEAANVAQISVGEATKQMSALMHIYGMSVGELDSALGVLVNTSQKFNVTTEDLLGGLDRSAAAAKVAGVGFAELQGLIGATVGGTGQSGVQVGNTIKNLFTQFTRPEIQGYLQSQGIATMKGGQFASGSDVLRQMFIRYQGMDHTQRQNLGTVIAGRLQVARFAGLMNEYPMAQKLAIDGQLRMNAAMATNAVIIGTVRAQLHGLGSEWDRLLVNTGSQKQAALGVRTFKNMVGAVADMAGGTSVVGAVSDVLQGQRERSAAMAMNGTGAWSAARTFNVFKGLGVSGLNFLSGHKLTTAPDFFDLLNAGRESDLRLTPEERLAKNVGLRSGRSSAYGSMAQLFDTAKALSGVKTEAADHTREYAQSYLNDLGLPENASYDRAAARARELSADQHRYTINEVNARSRELESSHDQGALSDDAYMEGLKNLQSVLAKVHEEETAEAAEMEEQINRRQEYVNVLREQALVMGEIGKLASQVSMGTAGNEADNQLRAAQATVEMLTQQLETLRQSAPVAIERYKPYQETFAQLTEAQANVAALGGGRYQSAVAAQDDRALVIRRADASASGMAVGYTEAEKLLRQRSGLDRELSGLGTKADAGTATTNELVRGWELQNQLAKTHEKIQERILELKGQEKQIIIDSTREFQKGLLMSGPGELLKRLYVSGKSARGGLNSTGAFMALDPESRRMAYELRGGEAGAKNRLEQGQLRGSELTVEQQQFQARLDRKDVNAWAKQLPDPMRGHAALPLPGTADPLMASAMKTAASVNGLGAAADTTAKALNRLEAKINGMTGGGGSPAPPPPAPKFGISGGHSLGSADPIQTFNPWTRRNNTYQTTSTGWKRGAESVGLQAADAVTGFTDWFTH